MSCNVEDKHNGSNCLPRERNMEIKYGPVLSTVKTPRAKSEYRFRRCRKYDIDDNWPEGAEVILPANLMIADMYVGYKKKGDAKSQTEILVLKEPDSGSEVIVCGTDAFRYAYEKWCQYPIYGYRTMATCMRTYESIQRCI